VEDALKCAHYLGLDGLWIPFGGLIGNNSKRIASDKYIDEWGTTFKKNKNSWPIDGPMDYPIKTRNDLTNYSPPSPDSESRLTEMKKCFKDQ